MSEIDFSQEATEATENNEANQDQNQTQSSDQQDQQGDINQQASWFYDDDLPGKGEKPEWLKDKYNGNIMKQAKAYADAEKRLGAFVGAPDAYNLDAINEAAKDINISFEENESLNKFLDFAKKNNASQEFVTEALKFYAEDIRAKTHTKEQIMNDLGEHSQQIVGNLANWLKEDFTDEEIAVINSMATSADQVKLLDKMRVLARDNKIVNQQRSIAPQDAQQFAKTQKRSVYDIQQEIESNFQKYSEDSIYRTKIQNELSEATSML